MHLLLLVTAAELALNRLVSKALSESAGVELASFWHLLLDRTGLFCFYFASTLAVGILVRHLWEVYRGQAGSGSWVRWARVSVGALFVLLAVFNVSSRPDEQVSFWFESAFVALVLMIAVESFIRQTPLTCKVGIVTLTLPLLIPFYGPLAVQFFDAGEAMWGGLSEQILQVGQWSMIAAALLSPYCFAPRPFAESMARFGPIVIAAFVSILGAIVLRRYYEVAVRLAHYGLGIDIGLGAPTQFLGLYLVALGTITWTVSACLSAESNARRNIGIGLGLLVVGGYGFAWPLQYLVAAVGLITIARAAIKVQQQEQNQILAGGYVTMPISDQVWHRYIEELRGALVRPREIMPTVLTNVHYQTGGTPGLITDILSERCGIQIQISIVVYEGSLTMLEIFCGEGLNTSREPEWTLYALPEKLLGVGAHPEPPFCSAPVVAVADDRTFSQRFRVRDAGGYSDVLLDDGLRTRIAALVDGWIAFWDQLGVRYRVYPGRGAPLDHPIPLSLLSFYDSSGSEITSEVSADRLVALTDLLVEIARNGLARADHER